MIKMRGLTYTGPNNRKYRIETMVENEVANTIFIDHCIKDLNIRDKFFTSYNPDKVAKAVESFFITFKKKMESKYKNILLVMNYPIRFTNISCQITEVMTNLTIYVDQQIYYNRKFFDQYKDMVIDIMTDIDNQLRKDVDNI